VTGIERVEALREELKARARARRDDMVDCPVCASSAKGKNIVSHFDRAHLEMLKVSVGAPSDVGAALTGNDDALVIDVFIPAFIFSTAAAALGAAGLLSIDVLLVVVLLTLGPAFGWVCFAMLGPGEGLFSHLQIDGQMLTLRRRLLPDRQIDLRDLSIVVGRAKWIVPSAIFSSHNARNSGHFYLDEPVQKGGSVLRLSSGTGCVCVVILVINGATKCCVPAVSFFNLLQNLAIFVKASHKRMAVWIEVVGKQLGQEKMKRLKLFGGNMWSGKSNAATTIFGRFDDPLPVLL